MQFTVTEVRGLYMTRRYLIFSLACSLLVSGAIAQEMPGPTDRAIKYSPYPDQNFPNQVFFGDTPADSPVHRLATGGSVISSNNLGSGSAPACTTGSCCPGGVCGLN